MTSGRTFAVVLLSVLLTVTLFGGTLAVGVERTALDEPYVTEQFENENVDSKIAGEFRADIATEVNRSREQQPLPTGISVNLNGNRIANRTVTDEFVERELQQSFGAIIEYLRGVSDEVTLRTDLRPLKQSVRGELINATEINTPILVGANSNRVDSERVTRLSEGERKYQEAQVELNDSERTEIEAELEHNVRQQLSNDSELLMTTLVDHQRTVLDGLTGELSYEEYVEQLAADEQAIKEAVAEIGLSAFPDEQSVLGEDSDPKSTLEPVRATTRLVVLFAWLSWLLAGGFLGPLYLTTRSIDRTATAAGTALCVAGVLGAVFGFVLGPVLKNAAGIEGGNSGPLVSGLIAVVDGMLRTIGTQSVVLGVIGAVILLAVVADRRGLFDGLREQVGQPPRS